MWPTHRNFKVPLEVFETWNIVSIGAIDQKNENKSFGFLDRKKRCWKSGLFSITGQLLFLTRFLYTIGLHDLRIHLAHTTLPRKVTSMRHFQAHLGFNNSPALPRCKDRSVWSHRVSYRWSGAMIGSYSLSIALISVVPRDKLALWSPGTASLEHALIQKSIT